MGMSSIEDQISHRFQSLQRFGESKYDAKIQMKNELGQNYKFGDDSLDNIYSIKTYDIYKQAVEKFVRDEKISKYTDMRKQHERATKYIQERVDKYNRGESKESVWTLKRDRAALGKYFGEQIPVKDMPKRETKNITRSRNKVNQDRHFSEDRNRDLVDLAKATGGRREDIEAMQTKDFFERNNQMFVIIENSKGGRDRISPVLPKYQERVKEIIRERQSAGQEKIIDKVHGAADIHSYRREYAQELLKEVQDNRKFKKEVLKEYPKRHETYTVKGIIKEVKSQILRLRDGEGTTFNRDDLYCVSQALGHNRLEIVTSHYIR